MSAQARANGIDIHYVEAGAGEPLLLLDNAMVSTSPVWQGQPFAYASWIGAFAERFRVIAPDTRGSGRTVHPGGPITYELLADDAAALIDALGLERPRVCGFSDGGAVATILALRHPGMVSAVVNHGGYDLFNPEAPSITMTRQILGGRPDATEPDFESIAHVAAQSPEFADLIGRMEADHDQAQGRGHWRTVIAQTYPRITTPHDYVLGDLAGLESPALVLVGDRDQFCTVEEGATASRAFPMGELAVLPGTGHLITDEAVRVAIDFLAR